MLHLEILLNGGMNLNVQHSWLDVTMFSKWPSYRSIWFKTFSWLTQNMFITGIIIIWFKSQKVCYWIILKIFKFSTTKKWMIIFLYVRAVLQAANWLSESFHIMYLLYKGCISCYYKTPFSNNVYKNTTHPWKWLFS